MLNTIYFMADCQLAEFTRTSIWNYWNWGEFFCFARSLQGSPICKGNTTLLTTIWVFLDVLSRNLN